MNSFMLVRHGQVVAEGWWSPYDAESPHSLYSLSKSFTSTAVGLAIAEGKLSVDDEVLKFFPDDAPAEPSKNLKAMRVSDLLRMSTGHQAEPPRTPERALDQDLPGPARARSSRARTSSTTRRRPTCSRPSSRRRRARPCSTTCKPRLFEPLGIEHPTWETSPQGISAGGYGLSIRTEDIAKFGQLYLQKGKWQGKQLVPAAWVEAATARQTSNGSNPKSDWDQGYGYQFWRCRHGAYRGDGAFGQYCIVLPEQDAVIAITSGVKDMQAVLNLVWDKLLPALKPSPLAADDESRKKLESTLKGLTLASAGRARARPRRSSGKTYVFPANDRKLEAITLESDDKARRRSSSRVRRRRAADRLRRGEWKKGRLAFGTFPEQPAAASGAWTGDDTFTAKICFYETPFILTLNAEVRRRPVAARLRVERRLRPDQAAATRGEGGISAAMAPITKPFLLCVCVPVWIDDSGRRWTDAFWAKDLGSTWTTWLI